MSDGGIRYSRRVESSKERIGVLWHIAGKAPIQVRGPLTVLSRFDLHYRIVVMLVSGDLFPNSSVDRLLGGSC
jgi:hypothetical protein